MTREEAFNKCSSALYKYNAIIAQLPTSFGKTKLALDLINKICDDQTPLTHQEITVLILVPRTVLKKNMIDDFKKWGGLNTDKVIIECYDSLKKYVGRSFDIVLMDEIHHLSTLRRSYLSDIQFNTLIGLSATLPKELSLYLSYNYKAFFIKSNTQDAIDNNIVSEPTMYKMPLYFDSKPTECIYKNIGKNLPKKICSYADRWNYLRRKDLELHIICTKSEFLKDLNDQIRYWERKKGTVWGKTKYLRLCGDRLKWLSNIKTNTIKSILTKLKNHRTITFCSSIDQSIVLGQNHCIHSKNSNSTTILDSFNNKKIKHISAVNCLNEGVNLVDCRICLFAGINASNIMMIQKIGRGLRHKKPIIILPYYVGTREEELVNKHLEQYDKDFIKTLNSIEDLKLIK